MSTDFTPDAARLEDLLRRCGKMLLELSAKDKASGIWEGEQFKADADRIAHEFLVGELQVAFPCIPVVSEEDESANTVGDEEHFIIDPIDGTASFSHGFAGWVTQAAYIRQQVPILAGIYAPASDEYFSAVRGQGAFCNTRHLKLGAGMTQPRSLIDNYPEPRGLALEAKDALAIPSYVESGSIALKICRVADGSADLFLKDMTPRDWDIAAPWLVLEEAGGFLTDVVGKPLRIGLAGRRHQGLIATRNAEMASVVMAWLDSRK